MAWGSLNIKFENPVVRISGIAEVALQNETPTGRDVNLSLDEIKGYTEERGNTVCRGIRTTVGTDHSHTRPAKL